MYTKLKIKEKVVLITLSALLLMAIMLATVSLFRMNIMAKNISNILFLDKLSSDLNSVEMYTKHLYGQLFKEGDILVDADGSPIEENFELVDTICSALNVESAIFVKHGNDFRRFSSSTRNNDGDRIVGTMLGVDSEPFSEVSMGNDYVGIALVNGIEYLTGYRPILCEDNEIIGLLSIGIPMTTVNMGINKDMTTATVYFVILSIFCIIAFGLFTYFAISYIHAPITETTNMLKDIIEGDVDLTKQLQVNSSDEVGELIVHFNKFLQKINEIISTIVQNSKYLQAKSLELSSTAEKMFNNADSINTVSSLISTSVEKFCSNSSEISSVAEKSSASVTNITTSIDYLSSKLIKVADSTEQTNLNAKTALDLIHKLEIDIEKACEYVELLVGDLNKIVSTTEKINLSITDIIDATNVASNMSHKADVEINDLNDYIGLINNLADEIQKSLKLINENTNQANALVYTATQVSSGMGEDGRALSAMLNEIDSLGVHTMETSNLIATYFQKIESHSNTSAISIDNMSKTIAILNEFTVSVMANLKEQKVESNGASCSSDKIVFYADEVKGRIANIYENTGIMSNFTGRLTLSLNDIAKSTSVSAKASNDIVNVCNRANKELQEIFKNTVEVDKYVKEVSQNINEMLPQIELATTHAKSTKTASDELYKIAEDLNTKVVLFKV
jgi:methyl-accepting chemotaxis protein